MSTTSNYLKSIIFCSTEDQIHRAKNLLENDRTKKWISATADDGRSTCIFQLEKLISIDRLQIGNEGSASVEVFVSNENEDWTILLGPTVFMTPEESRTNRKRNLIKTFKSEHFSKMAIHRQWSKIKIICEQKFNRSKQFGLSFIRLNDSVIDEEQEKSTAQGKDETGKKSLLENVHFILVGFENAFANEIREKAVAMGGTHHLHWNEKCTHLISNFQNGNNPTALMKFRNALIVHQNWIFDCFFTNQRLPESSYEFKNHAAGSKRKLSKNEQDLVENKKLQQGFLPRFFDGFHFYVSYGDFNEPTLLDILRVILAYDGKIEKQINSNVDYFITKRMWNPAFEEIAKTNPKVQFVTINWLQKCHDEETLVSTESFSIQP